MDLLEHLLRRGIGQAIVENEERPAALLQGDERGGAAGGGLDRHAAQPRPEPGG
jgi:hypothetical protein